MLLYAKSIEGNAKLTSMVHTNIDLKSFWYYMNESGASRKETDWDHFGSELKFDLTAWFDNVDNLANFPIAYKYLAFRHNISQDTCSSLHVRNRRL